MAERTIHIEEIEDEATREEIRAFLIEKSRLSRQQEEAKESLKSISEILVPKYKALGVKNIISKDFEGNFKLFQRMDSASSTISRALLLQAGVDPLIIDKCVQRTPYSTITTREAKEG